VTGCQTCALSILLLGGGGGVGVLEGYALFLGKRAQCAQQ